MLDIEKMVKLAILGWFFAVIIWVAAITGLIYVAYHIISKYW